MNDISSRIRPAPSHVGHRPPTVLNEKRDAVYPRIFDSGSEAKNFLIWSNIPRYVAGVERGVLPIGDWSTSMTERKPAALRSSVKKGAAWTPSVRNSRAVGLGWRPLMAHAAEGPSRSRKSVDLPAALGPAAMVSLP